MAAAYLPLVVLAAIGLGSSIVVHLGAILGLPNPFGRYVWWLHFGAILLVGALVLVAHRHTAEFKRADFWRAMFRGCPAWLQRAAYGFFAYGFVNFAWFLLASRGYPRNGSANAPLVLRGFSGHWMAFYAMELAALVSAMRIAAHDPARRCLQGHVIRPLANFCEECGSAARPMPDRVEVAGGR